MLLTYSILQSISFNPLLFKKAFVLENGLLPKKPFLAENGDGCADSIIKCFGLVIKSFLLLAYAPHKINTRGSSFSFNIFITSSVNVSQPLPLCDFGLCSYTVKTAFSNNTPCFAHGFNELDFGKCIPKSLSSSLKMFCREGGFNTSLLTENDKPSA